MNVRWLRSVIPLVALAAVAGCSDDPSGPGSFVASLTAPDGVELGAVVVQVEGRGIEGFDAVGTSQVFAGEETDEATPLRVVVVGTGALGFSIRVSDVAAATPSGTVITAVDQENRQIPAVGIDVNVELRR